MYVCIYNVWMHSMWHNNVLLLTENMGATAEEILNNINTTKELTGFFCADGSEDPTLSDLLFSRL